MDYSYWSFNNSENHFLYQKTIEFPYSLANPTDERIKMSLLAIIGFVRDAYLISEYQQPAQFIKCYNDLLKDFPEILHYIDYQYKSFQPQVKDLQNHFGLEECML